jgi:hypothetical protein
MADLCKTTPLPIALDEELIGVFKVEESYYKRQCRNTSFETLVYRWFSGNARMDFISRKASYWMVDYVCFGEILD